jgi:hypothetical protein
LDSTINPRKYVNRVEMNCAGAAAGRNTRNVIWKLIFARSVLTPLSTRLKPDRSGNHLKNNLTAHGPACGGIAKRFKKGDTFSIY